MHQRRGDSEFSHGSLEVICGCMFAGKSEEIIRRLKRAKIAKLSVVSFKPLIDNRYDPLAIASHSQQSIETIPVETVEELAQVVNALPGVPDVVGIDEAQFFSESLIPFIRVMIHRGARVVIAGLDTDWQGEPFGIMPQLLAYADKVLKLSAICMRCGGPAIHTHRVTGGKELVQVGAAGMYEARCRRCFNPEGGA